MPRTTAGYSTAEAAKAAGLTQRQAGYLVITGLMKPSIFSKAGTGNWHRWSYADVHGLAALGEMRARDVSLQALRQVERVLGSRYGSTFQNIHSKLVFAPGSKRFPNDIALLEDSEIISLLVAPEQKIATIVVDIHELFRQVRERLARIPQERRDHEIEKENQRAERKRAKSVQQRRAVRAA